MALARFVPVLRAATGLCNTRDKVRLKYDLKAGTSQLAEAVNVDIDDSGRVSRNIGYTRKRSEVSHSAWSDGENCLYVSGDALFRLNSDYSRTGIRSGLTLGARVSYTQVAGRIYYMNGFEKGFVAGVQSHPWVAGEPGVPTSNVAYSDPPLGHNIAGAFGRVLVARDNLIFASEPAFYGRFNLAKFHGEGERITMMRPVVGGLFVGTEGKVIFYRGERWENLTRVVLANYGVLEDSSAWCQPEALNVEVDGRLVVFSTPKGVCVGGPDGMFRNLTDDELDLPVAKRATGAVIGSRYITHIAP